MAGIPTLHFDDQQPHFRDDHNEIWVLVAYNWLVIDNAVFRQPLQDLENSLFTCASPARQAIRYHLSHWLSGPRSAGKTFEQTGLPLQQFCFSIPESLEFEEIASVKANAVCGDSSSRRLRQLGCGLRVAKPDSLRAKRGDKGCVGSFLLDRKARRQRFQPDLHGGLAFGFNRGLV